MRSAAQAIAAGVAVQPAKNWLAPAAIGCCAAPEVLAQAAIGCCAAPEVLAQANEKVLDVGCASMLFKPFVLAKNAEYTGLDLAENFKPNIVASADNLPFKDKSFDWVVLADILEHIPNPEDAVKEACRVGRKVIAVVPNLYRLNSLTFLPSHPNDKHITKMPPWKWLRLFRKYGQIEHVNGFFYCISVAFWPRMGIIDIFFQLPPFLLISDFFDRFLSKRWLFKYLGQELVVIVK